MSYFINPVKEDQCVFLSYEGEMPLVEAVAVRYEAARLLLQRHWNRLVVDITQLLSVTEMDLPKFAKDVISTLPRGARVALVIRLDQRKYASLIENFARSDGVLVTFFFDADEATKWVKRVERRKQELTGARG